MAAGQDESEEAIESVTYVVTQDCRQETFCVTVDTIVVRRDGTIGVVKAGTLIRAPVPDGPLKIEAKEPE